jgi:hypothetical protein
MHQDAAVQADNVVSHLDHGLPPCPLDIVLQFNTQWPVIITACQAAVDLTGLEYETPPLAQGHYVVKLCNLCHAQLQKKVRLIIGSRPGIASMRLALIP